MVIRLRSGRTRSLAPTGVARHGVRGRSVAAQHLLDGGLDAGLIEVAAGGTTDADPAQFLTVDPERQAHRLPVAGALIKAEALAAH